MIKIIHRYIRGRWERYYLKNYWHLILDFSLLTIVIMLAAGMGALYFYRPNLPGSSFPNRISVDLNNPPLELGFTIATSTAKLKDGSILKISFKNTSTSDLKNINLDFTVLDKNFSLDRLEGISTSSIMQITGRSVTLSKIEAGTAGELSLKAYFNAKSKERTINWQAQSQYVLGGQVLKESFNLPSLLLAAELTVKDAAYYTSPQGDQLGIGPLPPIVGIPTNYWIFWDAKGNGDFKNLVFSARLPKGIELTGLRSLLAGDFTFSSSTRQIIWKIPKLEADSDSYRLSFEVQLIPEESQVGQSLPLLSSGRYYGEDTLTGEEAEGSFSALTTNLDNDRFNAGQGKVVKP